MSFNCNAVHYDKKAFKNYFLNALETVNFESVWFALYARCCKRLCL